jgi:hypothetical protein
MIKNELRVDNNKPLFNPISSLILQCINTYAHTHSLEEENITKIKAKNSFLVCVFFFIQLQEEKVFAFL